MEYVFYYCTQDGEHMKMQSIHGKTENECIEKAYQQFGNSVTVNVIEAIAREIKKVLIK